MALFKRGKTYWFEFWFDGQRIRQSTKTRNRKAAEKIEAAEKTRLALVEAGLAPSGPPARREPDNVEESAPIPTLRQFAPEFRAHIELRCAEKPETIRFYNSKMDRLLEFAPLADGRLDQIDEQLIERYIRTRVAKGRSPATCNRELATLRRLLYFAKDKRKIIQAVPNVSEEMLDGERVRDFVLSRQDEKNYLEFAQGHLRDAVLLALDTGLRVGELVGLLWSDVHLEPTGSAKFGYLQVRKGKSKNARRTVPLTGRVSSMLNSRLRISERVFPIVATTLDHQHAKLRSELGFPPDFVLHSCRHTMLTRLGESGADAFTIKRIAGHSSITISERYVHPTPDHVERIFERFESYGVPTKVPTVEIKQDAALPVSAVQ